MVIFRQITKIKYWNVSKRMVRKTTTIPLPLVVWLLKRIIEDLSRILAPIQRTNPNNLKMSDCLPTST